MEITKYVSRHTGEEIDSLLDTVKEDLVEPATLTKQVEDNTTAIGQEVTDRTNLDTEISEARIANMLHLGAYDTSTYDGTTGIYTVMRQTGYAHITSSNLKWRTDSGDFKKCVYSFNWTDQLHLPRNEDVDDTIKSLVLSDKYKTTSRSVLFDSSSDKSIFIQKSGNVFFVKDTSYSTFESLVASIDLFVQYKLATSYTETYDIRHFARTGQPYIEEWKKSEADRSSNLFNFANYSSSNFGISNSFTNGKFTASGTNTQTSYWSINLMQTTLKAGTYTFCGTINGSLSSSYFQVVDYPVTKSYCGLNQSFTLSADSPILVRFQVAPSDSINFSINIMLNSGSVAIPYQPYEGEVVHGKGLAETLSSYPTSQSVSGTYLSKADASSTYVPTSRKVNGHGLTTDIAITKSDIGLGKVDNTADMDKPVSKATKTALDNKAYQVALDAEIKARIEAINTINQTTYETTYYNANNEVVKNYDTLGRIKS